MRLSTRLVIILMIVSGLGLIGTAATVYGLMHRQLYNRVDRNLYEGVSTWALDIDPFRLQYNSGTPSDYLIVRQFPDGRVVNSNSGWSTIPNWSELDLGSTQPQTIGANSSTYSHKNWRVVCWPDSDGSFTILAKDLESERKILRNLAAIESTLAIAVLVAMGVAGTLFVRRALAPLKEVEDTALAIADGDMDRRVPAWPRETEVGALSYAMNTMVTRLQETLEESQEKESQMRRFVGDASHELRTPLTSVRGYTELYRKGMVDDPDMVLSKIDEESARMKLLVEDLLSLTRAEGQRLNVRDVDMLELVLSSVSSAKAAFPERSISVLNETSDVPIVKGDPDRLHQVMLNLMTNAFKHAGESADGEPAEVTITLRRNLDRVMVDVSDNGVGMDPDVAEHIFERFYRADSSRSRSKGGGAGLGLAITKSIVDQHDGSISVTSAVGQGSTFTMSLPEAPAEANVEKAPNGKKKETNGKKGA
ncbi:HAMP domain-containing histidine kinase [Corynebacterium aquatimens]